jgi:hypothetical protein
LDVYPGLANPSKARAGRPGLSSGRPYRAFIQNDVCGVSRNSVGNIWGVAEERIRSKKSTGNISGGGAAPPYRRIALGQAGFAGLAFVMARIIVFDVATIAEVEKLALDLPESQRAVLAAHLLSSLPAVLHDEDGGIAEALRRDAELDANPSAGISLEQLDRKIERRRK